MKVHNYNISLFLIELYNTLYDMCIKFTYKYLPSDRIRDAIDNASD